MRRTFGRATARHCVARTSRTWLVPMPKATAPNAPCVDVWLSPHAIVMPGCVSPSSGPITCTMPWCPLCGPKKRMPLFSVLRSSSTSMASAIGSESGRLCESVGMMWSTVAKVRCGCRTRSPDSRSAAKACGLVTSWIRCSPMKSCVWPLGSSRTVWVSHTLSRRLRGAMADGIALGSPERLRSRAMRLLHTAHVPAGDGPFPAVIAIHRLGASAHDLIGLAPILHRGEVVVICPQGPVALQVAPGMLGYGWFPLSAGRPPDPDEFARASRTLAEFIEEACARHPVDRRHVVLL